MGLNLSVVLRDSAREYPEKDALIAGERKMSYGEVLAAVKRFANALAALGIERGDRVVMMVPNIPQFVIAYFGILDRGAVVVPINVLLKAGEISYHLEDAGATAFVVWEGFLGEAGPAAAASSCRHLIVISGSDSVPDGTLSFSRLLAESAEECDPAPTSPDDTAVILYTSGTTGRPKGAELTHSNLLLNAMFSADRLLHATPDDGVLAVLPLFHIFGQTVCMNTMLYAGASISLLPRFDPLQALEAIERDGVTIFAGVPTMYQYLLRSPERTAYKTSSLRLCVSGGAPLPVEVLHSFERDFDVVILEGYGLSETSPVVCFNRAEWRKPGTVGLPIWGIDLEVVDPTDSILPRNERGELVIRGHAVMKGYYRRPEATDEAMRGGWFHTGDVATIDDDGFVAIVDRIKDMILRGGYNVYPREIEEVLYQHPAVAECAVIGVPHSELGEEVRAVVMLKPGATATESELIDHCRSQLAAYKYPRSVVFLDQLPETATGKILKRELVAQAGAEAEAVAPTA